MANPEYFGTLARITEIDDAENHRLGGGESVVGSTCTLDFATDPDGHARVTVLSPRGNSFGSLSQDLSEKLTAYREKGWLTSVILTLVGFSDDAGYWGEVAIMAYPSEQAPVWSKIASTVAASAAEGNRLDVDFSLKTSRAIVEADGEWSGFKPAPKRKLGKKEVVIKSHRTFRDSIIEGGTARKPGCIVGTILFYAVMAALVFLVVMLLMGRFSG